MGAEPEGDRAFTQQRRWGQVGRFPGRGTADGKAWPENYSLHGRAQREARSARS